MHDDIEPDKHVREPNRKTLFLKQRIMETGIFFISHVILHITTLCNKDYK